MERLFLTGSLKGIVKIKYVNIDNAIFRLHYRATTLLLFAFSILVTGTQFFGDPIRCIQKDDIPERVINTYCWIESTFSLPKALTKKVGEETVYPGVEKYTKGDEVIEHAYYQWVCFVLFLQGVLFYIPRTMWKSWEGGKIANLLLELNKPILSEKDRNEKYNVLAVYFKNNFHRHNAYAFRYLLCEVLNFINVIGQIYLTNRFLGGEFTTYGAKVIQFTEMNQEERYDPMIRIFPRMTKCSFHRYGSSGSVQRHDALCILPLNIVNEKIYVFLWFWWVILAILSGLAIVYRALVYGWPSMQSFLLWNRNRIADEDDIKTIEDNISFGDWFILYLLGSNMHSIHFRNFVTELAKELKKPPAKSEKVELEKVESEKVALLNKEKLDDDSETLTLKRNKLSKSVPAMV